MCDTRFYSLFSSCDCLVIIRQPAKPIIIQEILYHLRSDFSQTGDMITIKKHVIKEFDNAPESFFIITVDAAYHNLSPTLRIPMKVCPKNNIAIFILQYNEISPNNVS